VYAVKFGDQLFLCVNSDARQQTSRPIGLDYPLVNGQAYAFDLRDGSPMWPGPAVIEQRGIALTQPSDSPLLIFVDRQLKRDAGGSGAKLRLLCLDRLTGSAASRNDDLPDTSSTKQVRIRASREEPPTVTVEMSTKTVRLVLTDRPRPPEPPANDLVEAPRKSQGRGLWSIGQRMGSAIQDVMQDPDGIQWSVEQARRAAEQQLDDD
jgi:hypothetical protein